MRHRFVAVLLERKREELGETMQEFSLRLFPNVTPAAALSNYSKIASQEVDIWAPRLPVAAEILGIPLKTLETI